METPSNVNSPSKQLDSAITSSNSSSQTVINLQLQTITGNNNIAKFKNNTFNISIGNPVPPLVQTAEGNIHWNLPKRNQKFTGRIQLLAELEKILTTFDSTNNARHTNTLVVTALHGIGGIGKTQLVTEYIHCHLNDYSTIIWIPSETREQIEAAYFELAKDLKLPIEHPSQTIRQVQKWLTQQKKYLLVFDNASDYNTLEEYLPSTGISNHHILITSRDSEWQDIKLEVGIFTSTEARDYLRQFVKKEETDEAIETLANTLGYLPLALGQAGAYIAASKWSIEKYLAEYTKNQKIYLQDNKLPVGDKHAPVFFTWDITFKTIQQELPIANELLKLSAYCSSEGIPLNFFQVGHTLLLLQDTNFKEAIEEEVREKNWTDAKVLLQRYMLWVSDKTDNVISIHPLIQTIIRLQQTHETTFYYLQYLIKIAYRIYPSREDSVQDYTIKQILTPHLANFLFYLDIWLNADKSANNLKIVKQVEREEILPLLHLLGDGFLISGNAQKAHDIPVIIQTA